MVGIRTPWTVTVCIRHLKVADNNTLTMKDRVGSRMDSKDSLTNRSAHPREADENRTKADVPVGMSAVGGKADVACQGLSGPFIARSGHSIVC